MKRKDSFYKTAKENLYCKDRFLNNFIDDMLIKCNQMFHYENLPDTIPKRNLEYMLMCGGYVIVAEHNGKLYALQGGLGGIPNEYYEYTQCIVNNPYLKLDKTFTLDVDCVIMRNDSRMKGLIPTLEKYGVMQGDCEISLNMLTNVLRSQFLISASDDKTKQNADIFIKKLIDGEFTCIGENAFLDGVKVHNIQSTSGYIQQFIELNQYIKASAFNELGLDANFNMKRERLTVNEVELNTSILIPLADDMLEQRKIAVEKINEMFGTDITVDLSSVWKMQKETVDKATESQETETEQEQENESETENKAESENESVNESETETENESETNDNENTAESENESETTDEKEKEENATE